MAEGTPQDWSTAPIIFPVQHHGRIIGELEIIWPLLEKLVNVLVDCGLTDDQVLAFAGASSGQEEPLDRLLRAGCYLACCRADQSLAAELEAAVAAGAAPTALLTALQYTRAEFPTGGIWYRPAPQEDPTDAEPI